MIFVRKDRKDRMRHWYQSKHEALQNMPKSQAQNLWKRQVKELESIQREGLKTELDVEHRDLAKGLLMALDRKHRFSSRGLK